LAQGRLGPGAFIIACALLGLPEKALELAIKRGLSRRLLSVTYYQIRVAMPNDRYGSNRKLNSALTNTSGRMGKLII